MASNNAFNMLPIGERLQMVFAVPPGRYPITRMARACCGNPTPILDEDHNGNPIIKCASCGART